MSKNYTTVSGDTFESISRKTFGTEQEAGRIQSANPGLGEPMSGGQSVFIPAPDDSGKSEFSQGGLNDVGLLINNKRFIFWDQMKIRNSIDSFSTLEFTAPFDHTAPGFKQAFRPFNFSSVQVTVNGKTLFRGVLVSVNPVLQERNKSISVSGYSLPGVLNDCTAPASLFPIEFNNQNLEQIASAVCGPFGLTTVFEKPAGPIFKRVAAEPTQKVINFLSELAKQRNLIISNTESGQLRFTQSVQTGAPVAHLRQGESPLISVTPTFSPQTYFSHITGLRATNLEEDGAQYTEKNARLNGTLRPFCFTSSDNDSSNLQTSVKAKVGRMFGEMASYTATVSTWRDPQGQLWKSNSTIKLTAPDAMVYNPYEFVISSVSLEKSTGGETATLELALPGAYSGEIPEVLPWD